MQKTLIYGRSWSTALHGLTILFGFAALLNMLHLRVPFFTTHAADLSGPALLYIMTRKLWQEGKRRFPYGLLGRTPEIAAGSFFLASVLTEISQIYYPRGIFSGRFDPLDIAAYGLGIGICYMLDKLKFGMIENKNLL